MMGQAGEAVSLRGRRALVTGAGGFLGANLVRALVAAECEVTVLARPQATLERLRELLPRLTVLRADVSDSASLEAVDPSAASDLVFHLAAAGTDQRLRDFGVLLQVNAHGTLQVCELARRGGAKRIVALGSAAEYGSGELLTEASPLRPASWYGVSKAAGWMAARALSQGSAAPVVWLRPFSPFGPFEDHRRLVPYTILSALQRQDVLLTGGEQTRDFVFVDDVIAACLRAAIEPGIEGEAINVCTGAETRVSDLATAIVRLMGDPVPVRFGAVPYRADEPGRLSGDPRKARERLRWEAATPIEEALRRTIEWFSASCRPAFSQR